jgi:DNA mismatch endonuclease, patch repair protein
MRGNVRRDTRPEKALRTALFSLGLRYRVDFPIRLLNQKRPIRPDIVFTRAKLAVFVDGCFWHGCPEHGTRPRQNQGYWDAKLSRNRDRDHLYNRVLEHGGWSVIRFWEHESPEESAQTIFRLLKSQRR